MEPNVAGSGTLARAVTKLPLLSAKQLVQSLTLSVSTVPDGKAAPKMLPTVSETVRLVGGVELPRPSAASAGKSGKKPRVELPISNAANGTEGSVVLASV